MPKEIGLTCLLIFFVHVYIFLSAVVYQVLEGNGEVKARHFHTELYLSKALKNWSPKLQDTKSKEFRQFYSEYHKAVEQDQKMDNMRAFQSLSKSYLFALTSITTVGNSGMTVSTAGGKSFYLASIITGILLYACMLHRISIPVLETMRYAATQICWHFDALGRYHKNPLPKLTVTVLLNIFLLLSILIFAVGGIFSGHSYLFGIFVTYDSVLTVGNEKWLPLLADWSETTFVLSLSLFLIVELSIVYTTIVASLDSAADKECRQLLLRLWNRSSHGEYEPLNQDDNYEIISTEQKADESAPITIFTDVERKADVEKGSKEELADTQPNTFPEKQTEMEIDNSSKLKNIANQKEVLDEEQPAVSLSQPTQTWEKNNDPIAKEEHNLPLTASESISLSPEIPVGTEAPMSGVLPNAPNEIEVKPLDEVEGEKDDIGNYYEVYRPEYETLSVPSRKSSSNGSDYSNLSVSDYEKSLDAELQKSKDFSGTTVSNK